MTRSRFGYIERLGPGRYRVWWTEAGNRRSKVVRGSLDDAEEYLARIRAGIESPSPRITYAELWAGYVLPSCDGLAPKTRLEYIRLWRVELAPRIARRQVRDTTWKTVCDVLAEVRSPSVQRSALRLWGKMLNIAAAEKIIVHNPTALRVPLKPHARRPRNLVYAEDLSEWMDAVSGIKYYPLLLCELGGGLRHEEACALLCEDVTPWELRGKTYALADVSKTLVTAPRKTLQDKTKTPESCRLMVIGEPFATPILAYVDGRTGPLVPSGRPGDDPAAAYTSPATITHNFRDWCEAHGVPYVRPGDMRASWSTMHGDALSPDSIVSLAMGHTDGTTRGRHYHQRTLRSLARIADNLEAYLEELDEEKQLTGRA